MENNRVKCGKCKSEYHPRVTQTDKGTAGVEVKTDYSCPVCGYGSFGEVQRYDKQMLLDWKLPNCS